MSEFFVYWEVLYNTSHFYNNIKVLITFHYYFNADIVSGNHHFVNGEEKMCILKHEIPNCKTNLGSLDTGVDFNHLLQP